MCRNNKIKNIEETVQLFKIYSDFTRLRIIEFLLDGEKHVQEIADTLQASQSAISHQLKLLRDRHVVRTRKEGKKVYYSLIDSHVKDIFLTAYSHVSECEKKRIDSTVNGINPFFLLSKHMEKRTEQSHACPKYQK